HANGARAVVEVVMAADDPAPFADFFGRLVGPQAIVGDASGLRIVLDGAAISVLGRDALRAWCPDAPMPRSPAFGGYAVAVGGAGGGGGRGRGARRSGAARPCRSAAAMARFRLRPPTRSASSSSFAPSPEARITVNPRGEPAWTRKRSTRRTRRSRSAALPR